MHLAVCRPRQNVWTCMSEQCRVFLCFSWRITAFQPKNVSGLKCSFVKAEMLLYAPKHKWSSCCPFIQPLLVSVSPSSLLFWSDHYPSIKPPLCICSPSFYKPSSLSARSFCLASCRPAHYFSIRPPLLVFTWSDYCPSIYPASRCLLVKPASSPLTWSARSSFIQSPFLVRSLSLRLASR